MFNPYQNNYPQQYYNNKPSYGDEIKTVNGRQSAEQYSMYPNSRVLLLDSNVDRFYLKETDAAGMSRIRTFDFKEVIEKPIEERNYVTMEQLEEVLKNYEFNPKQQRTRQSTREPNDDTKF